MKYYIESLLTKRKLKALTSTTTKDQIIKDDTKFGFGYLPLH